MKILITGASGFLGQYVVAAALRKGHEVHAIVRPASDADDLSWHDHPHLKLVRTDLRLKNQLLDAVSRVDAVIHLAAAKSGDYYTQFANTVLPTENLLDAMRQAGTKRLVAISTFSVFDYLHLGTQKTLDETSATEREPQLRDEYTQTKLIQEQLVRDFEQESQAQVTILRPGMVYGREDLWHALLGMQIGNTLLCVAPRGRMPLTYVENCAEAIVLATESEAAIGKTINIVDDDLPTRYRCIRQLEVASGEQRRVICINWIVMTLIAQFAWWINTRLLNGQARMPGILIPAKLHARFKPHRYDNQKAKELLKWLPKYSYKEAIERSISLDNLQEVSSEISTSSLSSVRV